MGFYRQLTRLCFGSLTWNGCRHVVTQMYGRSSVTRMPPPPTAAADGSQLSGVYQPVRHAEDIILLLRDYVTNGSAPLSSLPPHVLLRIIGSTQFGREPNICEGGAALDRLVLCLRPASLFQVDTKNKFLKVRSGVQHVLAKAEEFLRHATPSRGATSLPVRLLYNSLDGPERQLAGDAAGLARMFLLQPLIFKLSDNRSMVKLVNAGPVPSPSPRVAPTNNSNEGQVLSNQVHSSSTSASELLRNLRTDEWVDWDIVKQYLAEQRCAKQYPSGCDTRVVPHFGSFVCQRFPCSASRTPIEFDVAYTPREDVAIAIARLIPHDWISLSSIADCVPPIYSAILRRSLGTIFFFDKQLFEVQMQLPITASGDPYSGGAVPPPPHVRSLVFPLPPADVVLQLAMCILNCKRTLEESVGDATVPAQCVESLAEAFISSAPARRLRGNRGSASRRSIHFFV